MQTVTVKLDLVELQALLEVVETQLFRLKFIDPKYPGHQSNPEKLKVATSAIKSLKDVFVIAKGFRTATAA
jgi:hypothetical protein